MKRKANIFTSVLISLISLLIIACQTGCKHNGLNYSTLDTVCYVRDIYPIFITSCGIMGCHDQNSDNKYVFTDYKSIVKGIVPRDPYKSAVYKSIISDGVSLMPPGRALPENQRILIRVWIGQGADSTTCPLAFAHPKEAPQKPNFFYNYQRDLKN